MLRQPLHKHLPHDNTTIEVRLIPSDIFPTVQKQTQMSSKYKYIQIIQSSK